MIMPCFWLDFPETMSILSAPKVTILEVTWDSSFPLKAMVLNSSLYFLIFGFTCAVRPDLSPEEVVSVSPFFIF